MGQLKWTVDEIFAFMRSDFPQSLADGRDYRVKELTSEHITVEQTVDERRLRPGGTVSGPAMMELLDIAAYMLLLAHHGASAKLCVTTNLQISFLRKPTPGNISCTIKLLKHGRSLSVMDATLYAVADNKLIAHGETTYHMALGEG